MCRCCFYLNPVWDLRRYLTGMRRREAWAPVWGVCGIRRREGRGGQRRGAGGMSRRGLPPPRTHLLRDAPLSDELDYGPEPRCSTMAQGVRRRHKGRRLAGGSGSIVGGARVWRAGGARVRRLRSELRCGGGRRERRGCARCGVVEERGTWPHGRAVFRRNLVLSSAVFGRCKILIYA
jgi:hypothetical protein